ncbi:uncharacterized protein [Penaeus vannamei]|uniref:uncharacterized protein n=1 Tax=Penaeus vannamei TaxID=6689 RepID=UPI00387FA1B1
MVNIFRKSSRLQPSVVQVTPVDEPLMVMRLKLAFGFMSLIAVYTPTYVCKLAMKELFYAKLAYVSDRCPQCDIRIILGDLNVVSGCDQAGYEMSVGPHGSGTDTGSENSLLFQDLTKDFWLLVPAPRPTSLDAGNAAKEIDHILGVSLGQAEGGGMFPGVCLSSL